MKKLIGVILTLALVLGMSAMSLAGTDLVGENDAAYEVEGGNIYFDPGTGTVTGADAEIIAADIPAEIEGVAVTAIGESAFSSCEALESVAIPEGVTAIGSWAFTFCTALTELAIPDSVTNIGAGFISGDEGITEITVPANVETIEQGAFVGAAGLENILVEDGNRAFSGVDGVLFNADGTVIIAYPSGKKDASYAIPDGVEEIAPTSFWYCECPTEIIIPESLTTIRSDAISGCPALTALTIPKSVTTIEPGAFAHDPKLERFDVESGSADFVSVDGVLFSADKKTLYMYPTGRAGDAYSVPEGTEAIELGAFVMSNLKSVDLPDGLKRIGEFGFAESPNIASLAIPDSVASIGRGAFSLCPLLAEVKLPGTLTAIEESLFGECGSLTELTVPGSVTSVGLYAFNGCSALRDIYYYGPEERWSGALPYDGAGIDGDAVTVHFSAIETLTDIPEGHWGVEYINFALSHGLMTGVGGNAFNPNGEMTEGQALTIMARLSGVDTEAVEPWDKAGMDWGADKGYNPGGKASGDAVERQELIWMLWKIAGEPEADDGELDRFADAASVGADYRTAVAWALRNGITTGTDRGIEPEKSTSRAEFAAFVMRTYDLF